MLWRSWVVRPPASTAVVDAALLADTHFVVADRPTNGLYTSISARINLQRRQVSCAAELIEECPV